MATPFKDVKPFPGNPRAVVGGNRPPLDQTIVADFMEGLAAKPGLLAKAKALVERAQTAGPCTDADMAGRYADFVKMCSAFIKEIEAEREIHNRPLLTAQRALKAKSDNFVDQLNGAARTVRALLDAYAAEQRREIERQRREAEEQARIAREAAEAEARRRAEEAAAAGAIVEPEPVPLVEIAPVKVEEPIVRGDLGAKVGSTTVWRHEIESVRKLPDAILKHPKIVEALDKLIGQQVRSGTREMKGVRIWSEQQTVVR
jgi:hypothetical protein